MTQTQKAGPVEGRPDGVEDTVVVSGPALLPPAPHSGEFLWLFPQKAEEAGEEPH